MQTNDETPSLATSNYLGGDAHLLNGHNVNSFNDDIISQGSSGLSRAYSFDISIPSCILEICLPDVP